MLDVLVTIAEFELIDVSVVTTEPGLVEFIEGLAVSISEAMVVLDARDVVVINTDVAFLENMRP